MSRFIELIGASLDKRLHGLQDQTHNNPILGEQIRRRHIFEFELAKLAKQDVQGRQFTASKHTINALNFAKGFLRIHDSLSCAAQRRLVNRLDGQLKGPNGYIAPLAHETHVAYNLMIGGWAVFFHEYETDGGFDFLVRKDSCEIEIECKRASLEKGRKIHPIGVAKLMGPPLLPLFETYAREQRGMLIHIDVQDRFPEEQRDIAAIRGATIEAFERRCAVRDPLGNFSVNVAAQELCDLQTDAEVFERCGEKAGSRDWLAFAPLPPMNRLTLLVSSRSQKDMLEWASRTLVEASEQLSGTRPGVIWVDFEGLEQYGLDCEIRTSNLYQISDSILQRRKHVVSVAYSSFGDIFCHDHGHATVHKPTVVFSSNLCERDYALIKDLYESSGLKACERLRPGRGAC